MGQEPAWAGAGPSSGRVGVAADKAWLWPVLLGAVLILCSLALYRGMHTYHQAHQELSQVQATNQRLEEENRALYQEVLRLRNDPRAVERAARREMGLARQDEVIYQTTPAQTGGE